MSLPLNKPELLSPAGSEEALNAAVENGADAVYFGIAGTGNFNARVRAKNIPLEKLNETVAFLHRRNVRAYLTLNTLVFADELPEAETLLREFAAANVDAVLVQDLGIAKLAHELCPSLTLHASTQMSLTSAEAFAEAAKIGIKRVVLPRELSLEQIRQVRRNTDLELEAFVHGSLCVGFSGQCLTSLTLGGRSANRGCCAQPCRMPYTLIDASAENALRQTDLTTRNLFSPTDLAALPLLRELRDAGVCAFKIEGRLKSAEYVAEVTRIYREAIDSIFNADVPLDSQRFNAENQANLDRLALAFSRGFSTGWLEGANPRRLVPGNIVSHRGVALGFVIEVRRDAAVVQLTAPVRRGDGVLFENESDSEKSQGGRVYEIFHRKKSVRDAAAGDRVLLTFGNGTLDADQMKAGQAVRKTDDPQLERQIRKTLQTRRPMRRTPLYLKIRAVVGEPLDVEASAANGAAAKIVSDTPLEEAKKHPLTEDLLREQFGRLGGTIFELTSLDASLDGKAMIPLSALGQMRKKMVAELTAQPAAVSPPIVFGKSLNELRRETEISAGAFRAIPPAKPVWHILLRDVRDFEKETLSRLLENGRRSFYAELYSRKEYDAAAKAVRAVNAEFVAVAPRILLPGETRFLEHLAKLEPDAVLVRNFGALSFFRKRGIPCIADFSLNIVNDLAFRQLLELDPSLLRITFGYDLGAERFTAALRRFPQSIPPKKVEVVARGRAPLFTTAHCLWRANLVPPDEDCKQLCRKLPLKIRDRRGAIHTVRSDAHCRNIVESADLVSIAQTQLDHWIEQGVRHLRIEGTDEIFPEN
ncbi:MAG: U32 family peptidase [Planctomycetaceae bacterium]|jgi:putative protease|nr:U32 family peptidase [Planctomycetaceae bacterium]